MLDLVYLKSLLRTGITHSSTAKQEEKQEERGSCQTLQATEKKIKKIEWWRHNFQTYGICI